MTGPETGCRLRSTTTSRALSLWESNILSLSLFWSSETYLFVFIAVKGLARPSQNGQKKQGHEPRGDDVDGALPLVALELEVRLAQEAGVLDDHVEPVELLLGPAAEGLDAGEGPEVDLPDFYPAPRGIVTAAAAAFAALGCRGGCCCLDVLLGRLRLGEVPAAQDDAPRAEPDEVPGGLAAYAGVGSGDEDGLAREVLFGPGHGEDLRGEGSAQATVPFFWFNLFLFLLVLRRTVTLGFDGFGTEKGEGLLARELTWFVATGLIL